MPLLRRYHDALTRHGVTGYDFDALLEDYRLSVVWQLATPVWQATHGLPAPIWWNHLERTSLAIEDLGAIALLD